MADRVKWVYIGDAIGGWWPQPSGGLHVQLAASQTYQFAHKLIIEPDGQPGVEEEISDPNPSWGIFYRNPWANSSTGSYVYLPTEVPSELGGSVSPAGLYTAPSTLIEDRNPYGGTGWRTPSGPFGVLVCVATSLEVMWIQMGSGGQTAFPGYDRFMGFCNAYVEFVGS